MLGKWIHSTHSGTHVVTFKKGEKETVLFVLILIEKCMTFWIFLTFESGNKLVNFWNSAPRRSLYLHFL